MNDSTYPRFAGIAAILAGISVLLYSVAFIIIARNAPEQGAMLSALFLALGGLFSSVVVVGLYERFRLIDPGFALWALLVGAAGAFGSLIHGAYDLANAINPPDSNLPSLANLPSAVDPRGLLTFGIAGIGLLTVAWLMGKEGRFPAGLRVVTWVLAILLVEIYLARLIILQATSPLVIYPALLTGFVLNPLWNIWLGVALLSKPKVKPL